MANQNLDINVNVRTGDASKQVNQLGEGVENIGKNAFNKLTFVVV